MRDDVCRIFASPELDDGDDVRSVHARNTDNTVKENPQSTLDRSLAAAPTGGSSLTVSHLGLVLACRMSARVPSARSVSLYTRRRYIYMYMRTCNVNSADGERRLRSVTEEPLYTVGSLYPGVIETQLSPSILEWRLSDFRVVSF